MPLACSESVASALVTSSQQKNFLEVEVEVILSSQVCIAVQFL